MNGTLNAGVKSVSASPPPAAQDNPLKSTRTRPLNVVRTVPKKTTSQMILPQP